MDPLVVLLVVAVVAGLGWYLFLRPGRSVGSGPTPRPIGPDPTPAGGVAVTPDLQALKPGDAVSFWDGTDVVVRGSLRCHEQLGGRTTEWRWVFLTGDRMLELLPQGQALYEGGAVAHQGDEFYELLVGPGGSLKRFEANVREGIAAQEPVLVNVDDVDFRVRSTGTFAATREGELPEESAVWSDVSANPSDNVYFKMVRQDDSEDRDVALGIWTTHILVMRGRRLDRSEITGIFPAQGG